MKSISEVMKAGKPAAEEPDADDEKAGESEAYVADLQSAMDSGDAQGLYDTICAIMAAHK